MTDGDLTHDYLTDEVKAQIERLLRKEIEAGLNPYFDRIEKGLARLLKLVSAAVGMKAVAAEMNIDEARFDVSDEVLRSVIVLNHAYLEDFLRTVALVFLPVAKGSALDSVPLAGTEGRAEKFFLGTLTKHRGKTVEELIRESVAEHMERRTFNDVTEIMRFLEGLGLDMPRKAHSETLPDLDAMIRRRHMIVHNADCDKSGDCLRAIGAEEVVHWLEVTQSFLSDVARTCFEKECPLEVVQARVRKAIMHEELEVDEK
jgi:hypothetical protein